MTSISLIRRGIIRKILLGSISVYSVRKLATHVTKCDPAGRSVQVPPPLNQFSYPVQDNAHSWLITTLKAFVATVNVQLKDFLDAIKKYVRTFFRTGYLAFLFAPVICFFPLLHSESAEYRHLWWKLLRESIISSGPCIAKFAQWIATRPDLISDEGIEYLKSVMSSKRSKMNLNEIEQLLDANFSSEWRKKLRIQSVGGTKSEVEVIGCGCVAQVVKGKWYDGSNVAIKVIHTDVRNMVLDDISIIKYCFNTIAYWMNFPVSSLNGGLDEFAEIMVKQLDLRSEAENLEKFRKNFSSDAAECKRKKYKTSGSMVTFPKPMRPLVCSNLLVETYSEGKTLSDVFNSSQDMDDKAKQEIAYVGFQALLKMVFEDNFVHIDLHPGNIICNFDSTNSRDLQLSLTFVDAGIVTTLEGNDFKNFVDAMIAVIFNDADRLAKLLVERSRTGICLNPVAFVRSIRRILQELHAEESSFDDINVRDLMQRFLEACHKNNVQLEPRLIYLVLGLSMLEGMGKRLHPDMNLITAALPYIWHAGKRYLTNRERWYYFAIDMISPDDIETSEI